MSEEKVYTSMYSRNAELYHHGILGQKWGVQNGPPYPLDSKISTGERLKKVFSKKELTEDELKKKQEEKQRIANEKAFKKIKKESKRETVTSKAVKQAKGMTDDELKAAINRLDMEKRYANLEKDLADLSKKNPSLAKKIRTTISNEVKKQIGKTVSTVINSATSEINKEISKHVKNFVGSKVDKDDKKNDKKDDKKEEKKDDTIKKDKTDETDSVEYVKAEKMKKETSSKWEDDAIFEFVGYVADNPDIVKDLIPYHGG